MLRVMLGLLLLLPITAKAQDDYVVSEYFLVCRKEADMFVLMHTWKYYGYSMFLDALDFYQNEKAYNDYPACLAFAGTVGPEPLNTTLYGETELPLETSEGLFVYVPLYLWASKTPDGTFSVLSTMLPP